MTASLWNVIGQDVFRIDDEQYNDADFQAMSIDELEVMKLRISKIISGLSTAIANSKLDSANGKEAVSKEWLVSRRSALSINERVSGYVKSLISYRLRMKKTTNECFVRNAKATLPPELFNQLMNKAQQETADA